MRPKPQKRRHPARRQRFRGPHRLTPRNFTLDVTDAVVALGEADQIKVTVVATQSDSPKTRKTFSGFGALTLVAYD